MGCWNSFLDWLEWVVCGEAYAATHRGASKQDASSPTPRYSPRHQYPLSYPTRQNVPPPPIVSPPLQPANVYLHHRQHRTATYAPQETQVTTLTQPYPEHAYPPSSRPRLDEQSKPSGSGTQPGADEPESPVLVLYTHYNFSRSKKRPAQPHRHPASQTSPRPGFDYNQSNRENEYYLSLRADAKQARKEMSKAFHESSRAFKANNRALAKELSARGKQHKTEMIRLYKVASDWLFQANNMYCDANEIDLHGLSVQEAIARTDRKIQEAKQRGMSNVRIIVGKGLHAADGIPKLKPAVEGHIRKQRLSVELDSRNSGVLVVSLDS